MRIKKENMKDVWKEKILRLKLERGYEKTREFRFAFAIDSFRVGSATLFCLMSTTHATPRQPQRFAA